MTTISIGTNYFDLGGLRSEHRLAKLQVRRHLITGSVNTAVGLLTFLAGLMASEWLPAVGIIGLLFLLFGVWYWHSYEMEKMTVIRLYAHGLSYGRGGKTTIVLWDDLEHVYMNLSHNSKARTNHYFCQLHTSNGRRLTFNYIDKGLADIKLINDTIQRNVLQRRLPQALAQFHRGQVIDFGPIKLDQIGITAGKKSMLWQEVESMRMQWGMITIRQRGQRKPWVRIAAAKTANAFLLTVLVDQILWC
jgi:hypothetical protein